jgi:hypothetical protein
MNLSVRQVQTAAWGTSAIVTLVAFFAWGQLYNWKISSLYQLFPLLGLWAFSLMWSHYIAAVIRQMSGQPREVLKDYFEFTSGAVLVLILLHPGILAYQLWQKGQGLPPASYYGYIGKGLKVFITIAALALVFFLLFELRRWLGQKKWWPLIGHLSDLGMILIFVHSLKLGSHLREGWFKYVWYFYGVTFIGALLYMYTTKYKASLVK